MFILISIAILLLSSCASGQANEVMETDSASNLINTRWELVSYGETGSETPVLENAVVTLDFVDATQAGGDSGCNTFSTQYEIMDGSIEFTQIIRTEMACMEEGVMDQESAFLNALQNTSEYEWTGDKLTIKYNDGQSVLNFVSDLIN
jgi:heat shock protein HslJ